MKNKNSKSNLFERGINKKEDKKTIREVDDKLKRRIKSKEGKRGNPYMGLLFMGTVGWSFVFPFIICIGAGVWIDRNYSSSKVWTLIFMIAGVFIGFLNVIAVIKREIKKNKREL